MDIPVYESSKGKYMRIADLPESYERLELETWIKGQIQPLIQGKTGALLDCVFLDDYNRFLDYKKGKQVLIG